MKVKLIECTSSPVYTVEKLELLLPIENAVKKHIDR